MNWIFFLLMLLITFITYKINHKCYLAPGVVVSGMTTLSSLVIAINTSWDYTISFITVVIICGSVLLFNIGQNIGERFLSGAATNKKDVINYELKRPSGYFYNVAILFGLITGGLYFYQQFQNAASVGMNGSLSSIIEANRYVVQNGKDSTLIRLLFVCLKVVAYVVLAIYINEKIQGKKYIPTIRTFIIVGLYTVCSILTTNRSDIIALAGTVAFYILYFIYKKNNWSEKTVKLKTLMKVLLILIGAVLAFRVLGYLTGKSENSSFYDNISVYIGSSFVCLDKVITGNGIVPNEINIVMFDGLWNLFKMVGIDFNLTSTAMPHQHWGNGFSSNVYSSLFPYLMKFGIVGLFIVQICLGILYGWLWKKIRTSTISWVGLMVYAQTFFYYICMYAIAERITAQFISLTTFVEITAIWVLMQVFTVKRSCLNVLEKK